jgi:hypothetical protein
MHTKHPTEAPAGRTGFDPHGEFNPTSAVQQMEAPARPRSRGADPAPVQCGGGENVADREAPSTPLALTRHVGTPAVKVEIALGGGVTLRTNVNLGPLRDASREADAALTQRFEQVRAEALTGDVFRELELKNLRAAEARRLLQEADTSRRLWEARHRAAIEAGEGGGEAWDQVAAADLDCRRYRVEASVNGQLVDEAKATLRTAMDTARDALHREYMQRAAELDRRILDVLTPLLEQKAATNACLTRLANRGAANTYTRLPAEYELPPVEIALADPKESMRAAYPGLPTAQVL